MNSISVVLTTYNGEKYLIKQLDSLKNQTKTPDEIIIVDDVSTDKTVELIEEYIKTNGLSSWTLYKNKENLGFKKNFLHALSLSKGDIVFLCDQDDVWESKKIEETSSFFDDDNVFGIMTGFSYIDGDDLPKSDSNVDKGVFGFLRNKPTELFSSISLKSIMHRNISPGCTCAFRRSVIDEYLKNANKNLAHDYQLCCISAAFSGLYFYNFPLTKYRIHENNTLGLNALSQSRIEIAKEKSDLAKVFSGVNDDTQKISEMYENRLISLQSKKGFLRLLFNKNYQSLFTVKEKIGDLLYILR